MKEKMHSLLKSSGNLFGLFTVLQATVEEKRHILAYLSIVLKESAFFHFEPLVETRRFRDLIARSGRTYHHIPLSAKNVVVFLSKNVAIKDTLKLLSPCLALVEEHLTWQAPRQWLTSLSIERTNTDCSEKALQLANQHPQVRRESEEPTSVKLMDAAFSTVSVFITAALSTSVPHNDSFQIHMDALSTLISATGNSGHVTWEELLVESCQSCVHNAMLMIVNKCPSSASALIASDCCMFRYSNVSFFSKLESSSTIYRRNASNITDTNVGSFEKLVNETMMDTAAEAASGVRLGQKFATKETNYTAEKGTLYALGQCLSDLSFADCLSCVQFSVDYLFQCCGGKKCGRVFLSSGCNARYETYPFFDDRPRGIRFKSFFQDPDTILPDSLLNP
ncbi:hypothetical protein Nepgr_021322 [Nepenthes gracilis]|uniref:Gnk2-homologous domain-containing protein n=1 Tax=Nepenthes gracilis TaxID=150966 RepID=A0AAD3SYU8_NEPGR|nr:hypothetical protein Nepgr_021322 [Nepenthes gracilis]